MKSAAENRPFKDVLKETPEVMAAITSEEIDEIINPESYIGTAPEQVDAVIAYIKSRRMGEKTQNSM